MTPKPKGRSENNTQSVGKRHITHTGSWYASASKLLRSEKARKLIKQASKIETSER